MAQDKGEEIAYLRHELARIQEEEESQEMMSPIRGRSSRSNRYEVDGLESVHRRVMGTSADLLPPEVVPSANGAGRRKSSGRGHDDDGDGGGGALEPLEESMRFYQDLEQSIQELQSKILRRVGEED